MNRSLSVTRHAVAALCISMISANSVLAVNADDEQWIEVPSSSAAFNSTQSQPIESSDNGSYDKLVMIKAGDTLESISRQYTGDSRNWNVIARYNQLPESSQTLTASTVLIPHSLLAARASMSEIREISGGGSSQAIVSRTTQSALDQQEQTQKRLVNSVGVVDSRAMLSNTDHAALTTDQVNPPSIAVKNLDMFSGEVKVVGYVDVKRVAVGDGKIIRVEVLKSGELLIIAQSPGSSSVHLWHKDDTQTNYNVRVSEKDPETRFAMEKMVRMQVKMVEFRKSALGSLGINWGDSVNGPTLGVAGDVLGNNLFRPAAEGFSQLPNVVQPFSTYFGIAANLTSKINLLASTGDAVTLAEPVLSCANGGHAEFLAGGEVPYPATGANGETVVDFKEYGIKLSVIPEIDPKGNVRALIETEISQIDPSVTVQGAPGLLTRRAKTKVNVRSGETIVISGLLSSESSDVIDKLPGLGNLPVLGALFKSKNVRNSISELVIFVTPEVIDPAEDGINAREGQLLSSAVQGIADARQSLPLMD